MLSVTLDRKKILNLPIHFTALKGGSTCVDQEGGKLPTQFCYCCLQLNMPPKKDAKGGKDGAKGGKKPAAEDKSINA